MARKNSTLSFKIDDDPTVAYTQLAEAKRLIEEQIAGTLRQAASEGMRPGTFARMVRETTGESGPDNAVIYHAMASLGLITRRDEVKAKPAPKSRKKAPANGSKSKPTAAALRRTTKVTARTVKPATRTRRAAR